MAHAREHAGARTAADSSHCLRAFSARAERRAEQASALASRAPEQCARRAGFYARLWSGPPLLHLTRRVDASIHPRLLLLPPRAPAQSDNGLGGGLAYAVDPNFCDNILPMFKEDDGGEIPIMRFVTCEVRARAVRSLAAPRLIHPRGVSAAC